MRHTPYQSSDICLVQSPTSGGLILFIFFSKDRYASHPEGGCILYLQRRIVGTYLGSRGCRMDSTLPLFAGAEKSPPEIAIPAASEEQLSRPLNIWPKKLPTLPTCQRGVRVL